MPSFPAPIRPLLSEGRTLGIIGAGVMGQTLLKGLFASGLLSRHQAWAAAKSQSSCDEVASLLQISTARDYGELLADAQILLLCVKPAQAPLVAKLLNESALPADTLIISVLAGISTQRLESLLSKPFPVIRAMPNTPCVVNAGITVFCGGSHTLPEHKETAESIFASVGKALQVEEHYFNAITALSGSGPAYMYLVIESLADAGVRVGLPRDLALDLVTQTMLGSAKMVQQSGRHPAALRDDVTTPAGCTIGGLLMLEDGKIRSVLARAVEEATKIVDNMGKTPSAPKP